MPPLPVISGKDLIAVLERLGFICIRIRGSHRILRHTDGRRAVVPIHGNTDMPRGTLKAILRDIDIDAATFIEIME